MKKIRKNSASGNERRTTKVIDMIERITGMDDPYITLWNYETYETTSGG